MTLQCVDCVGSDSEGILDHTIKLTHIEMTSHIFPISYSTNTGVAFHCCYLVLQERVSILADGSRP